MPSIVSSISPLAGARRMNAQLGLAAFDDPGGKLGWLISAVLTLNTNVSLIQVAVMSANASAVGLSSLSGVTFTQTNVAISNFAAT
jgi:hypothetical protein